MLHKEEITIELTPREFIKIELTVLPTEEGDFECKISHRYLFRNYSIIKMHPDKNDIRPRNHWEAYDGIEIFRASSLEALIQKIY